MKRVTKHLLIFTSTFILGVAATTLLYVKLNVPDIPASETAPIPVQPAKPVETAALPVLDFCELANNPEKYNGQIVRLGAVMNFGLEGSWFLDSKCPFNDNAVANPAENSAYALSENKEVWKRIGKAWVRKDSEFWSLKLDMTIVGRFKNEIYRGGGLITPFQIEILQIEKASIID